MVKATHRLEHEATLTSDIIQKLRRTKIHSVLTAYHFNKMTNFINQLTKLIKNNSGNDLNILIPLVKSYHKSCMTDLANVPGYEDVDKCLQAIATNLEELNKNITSYQITITDAIDAYTLTRTTNLINSLQTIINEFEETIERIKIPKKPRGSYTETLPKSTAEKAEIDLARNLKCVCEEIRQQIGSPETRPRGLVISFMMYLCDAFQKYPSLEHNRELMNFINQEMQQLRRLYPELAKAGEDLQKAIANKGVQKP